MAGSSNMVHVFAENGDYLTLGIVIDGIVHVYGLPLKTPLEQQMILRYLGREVSRQELWKEVVGG